MGLVNKVVPLDKLEDEYVQWAEEMMLLSPLALRMIKAGLNARVGRTGRYTRVGRRRYHALLYDGRGARKAARHSWRNAVHASRITRSSRKGN